MLLWAYALPTAADMKPKTDLPKLLLSVQPVTTSLQLTQMEVDLKRPDSEAETQ